MTESKNVTAIVGQPVQIVLQSNVASTGYGWYLTALNGGVALYGSCVNPTTSAYGSPSHHAFDFLATKEGTFTVEFSLMAPWRIDEPAQTETYEIVIKAPAKTPAEDIEEAMKSQRFTNADAVSPESGPSMVLKYATPMASPVLKYAAPMGAPIMKYAAPMNQMDTTGPVIVYATPMAQARTAFPTNMYAAPTNIYAAPMNNMVAQPVYAAPMPQPMPMYAAPLPMNLADPRMAAASVSMLYAAPMTQANQMGQTACCTTDCCTTDCCTTASSPVVILYAAPMTMTNQSAQPLYAAPPAVQALYAAPMTQASFIMPPYAAPMAQASFPMPPYAAPCNPDTGCCC